MGLTTGIGMGIQFSRGGSQSWESYWQEHNILWTKGRFGISLPDDFGNSPTILPTYNTFNGTDDIAKVSQPFTAAVFVTRTSPNYMEAVVKIISAERNLFFTVSQSGHAYKRMTFEITDEGKLKLYYRDGTFTKDISSTNAISAGWHTVRIESSGGAYIFSVDGSTVAVTVTTGSNDGAWNLSAIAPSSASIGGYVLSGGTTYGKANVARVKLGDTLQWICNNSAYVFETGYPDVLAGDGMELYVLDLYGSGTKKVYGGIDAYIFDKGYSIFVKDGSPDIEVPNKPDGNKLNTPVTGYAEGSVVSGNLNAHNLADSKIRFINDYFDRSNATIWKDTCRASDYYDAGNTKDFHISEINFKTLIEWLNVGYAGMFFPKISNNSITDRALLEELILFDVDLTRQYEENALTYTGDIAEAVVDGEGNVLYDENGYVLIN